MPSPKRGTPGRPVPPAAPKRPTPADLAAPGELPKPHIPDEDKTSWIEIKLLDKDGQPVPGERYRILLPDGSVDEGTLDEYGFRRIEGIDPGTCQITFPQWDHSSWAPA